MRENSVKKVNWIKEDVKGQKGVTYRLICPCCGFDLDNSMVKDHYRYCPSCGHRLYLEEDIPSERKNEIIRKLMEGYLKDVSSERKDEIIRVLLLEYVEELTDYGVEVIKEIFSKEELRAYGYDLNELGL